MRNLLFALVLGGLLLVGQPTMDLHQEAQFDRFWMQYLLTKYGCPVPKPNDPLAATIDKSECKPYKQKIDRESFDKARELAKKIFDLDEPTKSKPGCPGDN